MDGETYLDCKLRVKRGYFVSNGNETEGIARDLNDPNQQNEIYQIAKQMV